MKMIVFCLVLTFVLSGVSSAATLFSPPLVAEGSHVLDCYLVNVSDQPRQVTIQVFDREGDIVKTVETVLGPGKEDVARTTSAQRGRYCKFVVDGAKSTVRGSILVRKVGVGAISALPAN